MYRQYSIQQSSSREDKHRDDALGYFALVMVHVYRNIEGDAISKMSRFTVIEYILCV